MNFIESPLFVLGAPVTVGVAYGVVVYVHQATLDRRERQARWAWEEAWRRGVREGRRMYRAGEFIPPTPMQGFRFVASAPRAARRAMSRHNLLSGFQRGMREGWTGEALAATHEAEHAVREELRGDIERGLAEAEAFANRERRDR